MKLSPNVTSIEDIAIAAEQGGADAVSAINTIVGMAIDIKTYKPKLNTIFGGLSGPAIKPLALFKVFQVNKVARPHRVPIIGQGGITNSDDAIEFLLAGASAVGVGTGLFYDPLLCGKINVGILEYLEKFGYENVEQLSGQLDV